MPEVVSKILKINIRSKSKSAIFSLLQSALGGTLGHDRGEQTIGDFSGAVIHVGDMPFDVMVPTSSDGELARVIDKRGEGIDSVCFAVDDMAFTRQALAEHGIHFAREGEFRGNKVAFVHPKDACGIALEFIQGPATKAYELDEAASD